LHEVPAAARAAASRYLSYYPPGATNLALWNFTV